MNETLSRSCGRLLNRLIRLSDRCLPQHRGQASDGDGAVVSRFADALKRYEAIHRLLSQSSAQGVEEAYASSYPWLDWQRRLAADFSKNVPVDFMEHPIIKETMVFHGRVCKSQRIARVRQAFGESTARELLVEDPVGGARICDGSLGTSSNRLYHAFHLAMYRQAMGKAFPSSGLVVEWGGGYGDMARLIQRLRRKSDDRTFVLIDLPAVGALQWVYLSAVLGSEFVHVLSGPDEPIRDGCVNIMTSATALANERLVAQSFVSTWALTESPHELQTAVVERGFFGASDILLAFSMDADNQVAKPLLATGGRILPVPYMTFEGYAPSSYGFR